MDSRLWLCRRVPPPSHKPPAALDDPDLIDLTFDPYVHLSYYDEVYQCRSRSSSPPPSRSPPLPCQAKHACIAAYSKAIMGLKEVVLTKDDDSLQALVD
jgi:hypothetical protein